ncbi:MAG: hypothetical protein ACKV0T_02140 [Planctomycetales bacterium]
MPAQANGLGNTANIEQSPNGAALLIQSGRRYFTSAILVNA